MEEPIKKISAEWTQDSEFKNTIIYDADGWDRKNYEYSFYQELITKEEFKKRLFASTILHKEQ